MKQCVLIRNKRLDELLASIPEDEEAIVEKAMSCDHLLDGDKCDLGGSCNAKDCNNWNLLRWTIKNKEI